MKEFFLDRKQTYITENSRQNFIAREIIKPITYIILFNLISEIIRRLAVAFSSAIKSTLNPLGLKVDFRALQRGLLSAIISMKIE